jgi:adenylate cyclase
VLDLASLMAQVAEGNLDAEVQVSGNHEVAQLGQAFNDMLAGLRQKRVLEKYVPMGARKDIEGDRAGKLELGGHRTRAAILFSDLRGFTSLSERLSAPEVVSMLNEFLEMMSGPISANQGDINEFIGDAILAVFRCDEGKNGALNAVRAAWQMQAALRTLREKTKNEEVKKLVMGIGIHVGDLVEGNIGSRDRVKYGVVGDTVNLAARIQDRSRDGTISCIFVSAAAQTDVGDAFRSVSLGELSFKGKAKPVEVFEVAAEAEDPARRTG